MFAREGLSRHIGSIAAGVAIAMMAIMVSRAAAEDRGRAPAGEFRRMIDLPREILPWRRDIEKRADAALAEAERAFSAGRGDDGERRLADVARQYPGTHAAERSSARLERLRQTAVWGGKERGALGVTGQVASEDGDAVAISPVAGWQTVVRRGTGDLREALIEAAGDRVFFEDGSASLTKPAKRVLKNQALWLKDQPHVEFKIIGHADDQGSGVSNLRLSHDRAVAVRQYLIDQGVSGNRLHVLSVGNAQPIAICTVQSCAAQNRRVVSEIRLKRQALIPPS
jgi:outer membrane protein OmpA-like peptidoglycan-associated protein